MSVINVFWTTCRRGKPKKSSPRVSALIQPRSADQQTGTSPNAPASKKNASVFLAALQSFRFACRIYSGPDELVISYSIVDLINRNSLFLPTLRQCHTFKPVDGHCRESGTSSDQCDAENIGLEVSPAQSKHVHSAVWRPHCAKRYSILEINCFRKCFPDSSGPDRRRFCGRQYGSTVLDWFRLHQPYK